MDVTMYEILDRHVSAARRPKRDWKLFAAIALAAIMLVAIATSVGRAVQYSHQYHVFVQDVSNSLVYARQHHSLDVTRDGEPLDVEAKQVSVAIRALTQVGMGRPNAQEPDGGILITFGDGSSLQLTGVALEDDAAQSDVGLLVRYAYPDGHVYAYDTDQLKLEDLTTNW